MGYSVDFEGYSDDFLPFFPISGLLKTALQMLYVAFPAAAKNVRVSIARRDAGGPPRASGPGARSGPLGSLGIGEFSVRRIRWYADGNV